MSTVQAQSKPDADRLIVGWRVDPEIRKALKASAALDGVTMEDKLHVILCKALDRTDLLQGRAAT